jgi:hypothetical protein
MGDKKFTISVGQNMIDITNPQDQVEVILEGGKLWVNVDGLCRLRVQPIPKHMLSLGYRPGDWK